MSFYRTLLAAVAAIVIASPVFADDVTPTPAESTSATAAPTTENSSITQESTSAEQGVVAEAKVNINKATPKDLMKLKGVNASKARALVACRNKQSDKVFKSLDDISKCKEKAITKVKAKDLKAIEDQLTVE